MSIAEPAFSSALALLLPGWDTAWQVLLLAVVAAAVLSPLEALVPAYPQRVLLRKGLWLDLGYWFITPLLTRMVTGVVLAVVLCGLAAVLGLGELTAEELARGFGPAARQPLWLQMIEILLIADFVDYWTHRTFHKGRLWRIHAIHHSPEEMSWLSSSRVHPLNDLITRGCQVLPIMLLGFSANAVLCVVPYIAFYVMFLHSNVRWDFGPLRWVVVSPAYHRWHHASDREGIDKNFAGIFPIWDLLFGTCYFPRRLPTRYGLCGQRLPESFVAHCLFPFTRRKKYPKKTAPEGGAPSLPKLSKA